jgi:hypothetical protein
MLGNIELKFFDPKLVPIENPSKVAPKFDSHIEGRPSRLKINKTLENSSFL